MRSCRGNQRMGARSPLCLVFMTTLVALGGPWVTTARAQQHNPGTNEPARGPLPQDAEAELRLLLGAQRAHRWFYVDPDIPAPKLATASASAGVPPGDTVIGLIQATVDESANMALLFCRSGIYYRTRKPPGSDFQERGYVPYADFPALSFDTGGIEISLGEGRVFFNSATGFEAREIVRLLDSVKLMLRWRTGTPFRELDCLGTRRLTGPCRHRFTDSVYLPNGFRLVTNGYPVEITVDRDLIINGTATIVSFDGEPAPPPKRLKAASGAQPGAPGASGQQGTAGTTRLDVGNVYLRVSRSATGTLAIINRGSPGQPGGDGGDGGDGAAGPPGRPAQSAIFACAHGGTSGGRGGDGGAGGAGGPGGPGGDGGRIEVEVGNRRELQVTCDPAGGDPGHGGKGGRPGNGGPGGPGGEGAILCNGGDPGSTGARGKEGELGPAGRAFGRPGRVAGAACAQPARRPGR
jgi:hypothetical protein